MSFEQKDWKDRIAEYINRRRITHEDGTSELITVERDEGTISQEGDAFNAENMNEFEERIAKALTPLDTMEEINANTQDNQLAGALAVKELWGNVNKIDGSQILSTPILEKSLSLAEGVHEFRLNGAAYSGNDLPELDYAYGNATVYVRSSIAVTVVLHGISANNNNKPIAMNYYDGNKWGGWVVHAMRADLANYLPLSGGKMSGEVIHNAGSRWFYNDRNMLIEVIGGTFGFWDSTNARWWLNSEMTKTNLHQPLFINGSKALTAADFVVTGSADEAILTINLD